MTKKILKTFKHHQTIIQINQKPEQIIKKPLPTNKKKTLNELETNKQPQQTFK